MPDRKPQPHVILTTNGVEGACAAALVLRKYPHANIQITSPRHLPFALARLREKSFAGDVHVCGIELSEPVDDTLEEVRAIGSKTQIRWYGGAGHTLLREQEKALSRHCTLHLTDHVTDAAAIAESLKLGHSARPLLEVAEESRKNRKPRSEWHRFAHDLIRAANRRFYFFGDDRLNEKAMCHLAGLEECTSELEQAVEAYRRSPDALYPLGSSRAMKALRQRIGRLGPVPEPVLVQGPTGSGKEMVARALHVTSEREGAFVAVNCAVLGGNPGLVEDRLFGHVKGAYTGGERDTKGAFEEAHDGTLFLDEIGELLPGVQSQLLRVLEERAIRPMGTMATRAVDVRIVAATHRNLGQMVSKGEFREDLFYRLNVLTISVPPLKERPEDMKSIADHVARELEQRGFTLNLKKTDWDALCRFEWPGNVRQFLNVLKRTAYLMAPVEDILAEEIAAVALAHESGQDALNAVCWPRSQEDVIPAREVYGAYLQHALSLFEGNISQTAKALEVAPNTLRKYLRLE